MTAPTLVLGLGNILLRDDGIGVFVADSLARRFELPPSVDVLEGGTLGLDLLPRLEGVARLLLIDAVALGRRAGEVVRLEGDAVPAALDVKVSPHQIGLQDLLGAARLMGHEPPLVVLWGIQPQRLDPGIGFSPPVASALAELEDSVLAELRGWGARVELAGGAPPSAVWWAQSGVGTSR